MQRVQHEGRDKVEVSAAGTEGAGVGGQRARRGWARIQSLSLAGSGSGFEELGREG